MSGKHRITKTRPTPTGRDGLIIYRNRVKSNLAIIIPFKNIPPLLPFVNCLRTVYGKDYTRQLRKSTRERDNYTCQICHTKLTSRTSAVHHINYNKADSSPLNLITLCFTCHHKTNRPRQYWYRFLYQLLRANHPI